MKELRLKPLASEFMVLDNEATLVYLLPVPLRNAFGGVTKTPT